jgi:uncharacterized membrane protein YhaH (DUF805 family)
LAFLSSPAPPPGGLPALLLLLGLLFICFDFFLCTFAVLCVFECVLCVCVRSVDFLSVNRIHDIDLSELCWLSCVAFVNFEVVELESESALVLAKRGLTHRSQACEAVSVKAIYRGL